MRDVVVGGNPAGRTTGILGCRVFECGMLRLLMMQELDLPCAVDQKGWAIRKML